MRLSWNLLNRRWIIISLLITLPILVYSSEHQLELAAIPDDLDEYTFRLLTECRQPVVKTLETLTQQALDTLYQQDNALPVPRLHAHIEQQLAKCAELTKNWHVNVACDYGSLAVSTALMMILLHGNFTALQHYCTQTCPLEGENLSLPCVLILDCFAASFIQQQTPSALRYTSIFEQMKKLQSLNTLLADHTYDQTDEQDE